MPEPVTPMVKQYEEIKSRYTDAILFFRLGDFYEMFNDDAKTASRELELTLTGRGEGKNRMPMCGVPHHSAANYVSKLLSKGYKVAICDQIEDPALAKGVVKRDVVKVITPGTVQDEKMLDPGRSNYLLALTFTKNGAGLAYADASTGEFKVTFFKDNATVRLMEEIDRLRPSEILVPDIVPDGSTAFTEQLKAGGYPLTSYKDSYDEETAVRKLKEKFGNAFLDSFGLRDMAGTLGAAAAVLDYLGSTQKGCLDHMNRIQPYRLSEFMYLDQSTRRNLELIGVIKDGGTVGSLFWVLDHTSTPMGGRLLKKWMQEPLLDPGEINGRLDAAQELKENTIKRGDISADLKLISDMERVIARIASGVCNAKDLVALKESLERLPRIKSSLKGSSSRKIKNILALDDKSEVSSLINRSLVEDPPHALKEGGIIREGFNEELDEIRSLSKGGKDWIHQLELRERQRICIKSLKVGYTSVFGYYIEISKSNLEHVPHDYIRKQTLVNCERFITPELKEKEALILNAEEKLNKMEYEIFTSIRQQVASHTGDLQVISRSLAELDVLNSLAEAAALNRYCRPSFSTSGKLTIKEGRHPVVERTIGENRFVPNDVSMDSKGIRFLLITGPNMAGKSTYMRQIALICLMAQMGSFVPAKEAILPLLDRIFTRIGAMDDIYSGRSTFMVEMTETANIMNNATEKSLVVLDEIGRGTSTFDGMSIAAAVAEHINNKIKAYALFATHYHEITQLEDSNPGMKNLNTLVRKEGDSVIFLHKIVDGPADQSYGIEVAKLAGLPVNVIERAKKIYDKLEMVESDLARTDRTKLPAKRKDQMGLFKRDI